MSNTSHSPDDHIDGLIIGQRSNGRNKYSRQGKQQLVQLCLRPGVSHARMAMLHGVNANLLRRWVKEYTKSGRHESFPNAPMIESTKLLPVVRHASGKGSPAPIHASIEIDVAGTTVRLRGAVDAAQLRQVLDCLMRT